MLLSLILIAAVLYLVHLWMKARPKNFPPGPPHLPLIGSVPFMKGKLMHFQMEEWRQRYGPVVGLLLGPYPAIAVVGPEAMLEVLKREEFQARPSGREFRERSFGKRLGIIFSDGPFWVEQRRFSLRHLRDFGFGKSSMEGLIMQEVRELLEDIRGETVQVNGLFNFSTINVLWAVMAGTRFSKKDPGIQNVMAAVNHTFRAGNPTGNKITLILPFLKKIAPEWSGHAAYQKALTDIQTFLRDEIHKHEETLDEDNPRDYMDVYITEMHKQASNPKSTFTEEALIMTCLDLFSAGAESVGNTLSFAIMYLVLHPEVQRKVQAELDAVVGREGKPQLQDRSRLPYTEAVLAEVSRINTIAPITPPHRVTRDTELNGYFIPKHTVVLPSLWCLFHDKEHWGNPQVFCPERFIDAEGKFIKDDWLIPFGLGKRVCVGESLARTNLFLFFTSLLHEFSFSLPEKASQPSIIPLPGFTTAPQPFTVCFTER